MVNPNDAIRFTNVVSKKYRFHYKNMDNIIKNFFRDLVSQKLTIKGPLFYSINNVPLDEMVNAEFFMPIAEDSIVEKDDLTFRSYFAIENMVSICLYHDFERNTEFAYQLLLEYMDQHGLSLATPFFHVISGDETLQYVYIKAGVA